MVQTDIGQLPREFRDRLGRILPDSALESVTHAFAGQRPTTFRVNTLRYGHDRVIASLSARGFVSEPVPWMPGAFVLTTGTLRDLTETEEYTGGTVYVQSLSSMLPPIALDPKPGERVLDITAAPGSKTTQMAAMMENLGEITANDSSRTRSYRLAANLKNQGVTIARLHASDARSVWQAYPEYFDRTLADVPCSMEGRFSIQDPKTYADWTLKKVKDLSHLERWILRSAVSATKPGGLIVYSTCTLSPEENEEVVDWILKKEKGAVVTEELYIPGFRFEPALRQFGSRKYDASVGLTGRVYPSETMEGFYIAKLRKVRSSLPNAARR